MQQKVKTVLIFGFIILMFIAFQAYRNTIPKNPDLIQRIDNIIKSGADINTPLNDSSNNYTLLHEAAMAGNIKAAKLLLENNADVNSLDRISATPLHRAVQLGNVYIARLLIENGADINAKTNSGDSILSFAVSAKNYRREAMLLLINSGVVINTKDTTGYTPLHWAAFHGHSDAAEVLIENGSELNAVSNDGDTPLHVAAQRGNSAVAEILLKNAADPWIENKSNFTAGQLTLLPADPDRESATGKKKVAELIQATLQETK